jgi:hypothetical protein
LAWYSAGKVTVLEAGDEHARAEHQRRALGLAALELDAVGAADEIDDELVAVFGLLALLRVGIAFVLAGDAGERGVDLGIGHRRHQALDLKSLEARRCDLGQHLQVHRQFGVLALGIAVLERDPGLHGRAQRLVLHQGIDRFADRFLDRLRVELGAVHLAQQVGRHLPGAEAGHPHRGCDPLQFGGNAGVDVRGGDGQLVAALEALAGGLGDLHGRMDSRTDG